MRRHSILYTSIFILLAGTVAAQDTKPPENTVSSEIEVVRPYKPILAEAVKLRRSPDLDNLKAYKAKFSYAPIERKLELNTDIQKLQAQKLAEQAPTALTNNYLKIGLGNFTTLNAEGYIATGKDEALQSGLFFKHFSQSGSLNKQNENSQQISAFGRSIGEKNTLNGRLNWQRHGLYFYGFNPDNPDANPNPENQTLNLIEIEGEIAKRFSDDDNALRYATKANFYLFNDRFNAKENLLSISAYLNKKINTFNTGLNAAIEMGSSKDSLTSVSNHLIRLNPYILLEPAGIKITAGVQLVQEFGDNTNTRIFPAITADFTLIPDYLQLFAEVKGDVNRNSLKNLSDENPFLNSNILIKNSVEKLTISGGIKGTGGPGFGYKARFYSKKITDMPLFVNNYYHFNKFDVIYDFGDTQLTGLEGEISVQVSDNLKWTGRLNIEDYKPASEQQSYFKPGLKVSSNLLYTINKKLSFHADVLIQDDSKAKTYIMMPQPAPYPLLPYYVNEGIVNVKGFVDLGAGATYKINNKFAAFLTINNLLNTKYSQYLYYRVNGFNAFGGINYSF